MYASLLYPWAGPDCTLPKGSVLAGHIVRVQPRAGSTIGAEVTVTFDKADCNGQHNTPVQLLLYAIIEPAENGGAAMHDRAGLFGSTSPHPVANEGPVAHIDTADAVRNDISGGLTASADQPGAVKAGQVLGESGVAIDFSRAEEALARVYAPRRDFRINSGAQLVLIALPRTPAPADKPLAHRPAEPEAAPASPPPNPRSPALPVDETEICAANCSAVSGAPTADTLAGSPDRRLLSASVTALGYHPAQFRPRSGFDHETTLSFLSNGQLLLTFDTHHLRERTGEAWHAGTRRPVRAVLLDAATLHVQRVVDWQVDGDGQYLWKAGPGRVLVHRQGALHLVGPDLRDLAVIPARGDLAWISTSPSGKQIAFGLRRERHGREAHEEIQRLSGVEPVEDVEIEFVDSSGKLLLTRRADTTMVPPVLVEAGEVLVQSAGTSRWRLLEQGTDGKQSRPIATLTSDCVPRVSAPSATALFVVGCDVGGGRWMRLLRPNGHAILTSRGSQEEIEETVLAGDQDVATHLITLRHASNEEVPRSAEELDAEHIQVRRASDGRLLLDLLEHQFPPSGDGYALSPDGKSLATVTRSHIEVRAIPEG